MTVTSRNADLLARAERVMSGGVPGGAKLPDGSDFVVARGSGCRVWDADGREYVDYVLGSGPMILGHAHPAVIEAVARQIERGTQFYMSTEPAIELAETIVEAAGGDGLIKYASTGSEAVAHAIRLARAFTGRNKILKFEGGYHGTLDVELVSVTPPRASGTGAPIPDSAGIPPGVTQDVLIAPYNDLEQTGQVLAQHAADVACIVVEAGQRCIDPASGFLEGLRGLTRDHRSLLVFDEVVTGFRLAFGGAREYYGVRPDLAAYAKIIGGGYPLAAVWGREEIMAPSDPRRKDAARVQLRGTLSGNPVSTAAGLATIEQLRRPGVASAAQRQGVPLQVVGEGPIAAVSFTDEPLVDYHGIVASDKARLRAVQVELLRRGIFVNLDAKFYISTAHTDAEIDSTVEAFEAALAATG
jgi:glutamate-1-semialdehyde 2,1-aminomutase